MLIAGHSAEVGMRFDGRTDISSGFTRPLGHAEAEAHVAALRTIIDSVSDAIFIHALDGTILDVNDTMLSLYRVSREEACALSIADDYSSDENPRDELSRYWAQALAGVELQFPWLARRPGDGSTFPVEVTLRRLALPQGDAILATVRDTTAHRQVEAALRGELAFNTALLDTLGALVVVVDRAGTVVRFNRVCERLSGYSQEDVQELSFWDTVLLPEDRAGVAAVAARIFAGHYPITHENVWVTRLGERRLIAWRNTALVNPHGVPTHLVATGIDITEQRRLETAYAQAQKMESVGRLAGGVAHDFNNLLTVIAGASELALGALPAGHGVREELHTILRATDRASGLTRQLLAFARRQVGVAQTVDIQALIADLAPLLRRVIPEHVGLEVRPMLDLWRVQADAGQLEQVLVNLCINGRDAMPSGGRLIIAAANLQFEEPGARTHPDLRPGPYVQIAITDTGVGMAPEVQERAFEPFFSTKPAGQGTGLGLATCYGIIRQHGGAIWLDSVMGYGTTVTLALPAATAALAQASAESAEAPPSGKETIMVVEDDAAVRQLTARLLCNQGYTVLEVASGMAALELAASWEGPPIALLLTDMVMPELSGPDLAEQITALLPGIRVLFMSGYSEDPLIQNAVLDADVAFIAKPFTVATLARKVRGVLHGINA